MRPLHGSHLERIAAILHTLLQLIVIASLAASLQRNREHPEPTSASIGIQFSSKSTMAPHNDFLYRDARLEIYQEEVDVVLPMINPEEEEVEVLYDANNPLLDAQDPLAEDEQDPVFQRYERILNEAITSAREDLVDLVHRAYADAIGDLRAEIAGAEARRDADRQSLESRLQEFRSEILDMLSNARVEGRAELGEALQEIAQDIEREMTWRIEEGQDERIQRMDDLEDDLEGMENRLRAMDNRLITCEEHHALADLLAPRDSDPESDVDAVEYHME
ncbi:hypothetical protein QAD02_002898 [Eretmocerus hayati]|uniref:Uncharacterized protein n=1 Tax=Eretmocerus hayati TaxID=131215 RepID=A0ACC2NKK7_9HYME|nr:hypothetical protein QAD02_002898 [Eretmocerus hayati]